MERHYIYYSTKCPICPMNYLNKQRNYFTAWFYWRTAVYQKMFCKALYCRQEHFVALFSFKLTYEMIFDFWIIYNLGHYFVDGCFPII